MYSEYYNVSFGSNKNNDYFRTGVSYFSFAKILVTFTGKFRSSEALFSLGPVLDNGRPECPKDRETETSVNKFLTHCLSN